MITILYEPSIEEKKENKLIKEIEARIAALEKQLPNPKAQDDLRFYNQLMQANWVGF